MSDPLADDEKPLDPAAASIVARVRWLMLISGATTFIGVAAILGVIGYRVFKSEGSAPPADATALLPKGARIVSTAERSPRRMRSTSEHAECSRIGWSIYALCDDGAQTNRRANSRWITQ